MGVGVSILLIALGLILALVATWQLLGLDGSRLPVTIASAKRLCVATDRCRTSGTLIARKVDQAMRAVRINK
jgi:hypothetical protein